MFELNFSYDKLELKPIKKSDELGSNDSQTWSNKIIFGDCVEVLKQMPENTVDLIMTSPPYADSRERTYGGVTPDDYADWFLPITLELKRVLKPDGTFILNIKEKVVNGQRHNYVIKLILGMQNQGWLWTEEYIWHKKNSYPGKWPNRFRDSWERCLQFNKQKRFKMYQESVMVPMGDWAKSRLKKLSDTDRRRDSSKVESGFGKNISNWVEREMAYPTNVLHLATECGNKKHSATFPKSLPSWFIKLFSAEGDMIFDPFMGSGTTGVAAKELGRKFLGVEIKEEYFNLAVSNISQATQNLQLADANIVEKTSRSNTNMTNQPYELYYDFLTQNVLVPFYKKRLDNLFALNLADVLKRKNPYLFKAKNIGLAGDFVKSIVDAYLSSQEETIFGNLLEAFAIYVSSSLYGGFKSNLKSVDLEFEREGDYYVVGIKSGIYWGNSDQINKMKDNFKKAKQILREERGVSSNIVAVNGCMYGKDANPLKDKRKVNKQFVDEEPDKIYYKYAGQDFWEFISEDENLYQGIIVPIDEEARKKDEVFKDTYNAKVNEMTTQFSSYFIKNNQIDWVKLVDYVSKRGEIRLEPSQEQMHLELTTLEEPDHSGFPLDLADALDLQED